MSSFLAALAIACQSGAGDEEPETEASESICAAFANVIKRCPEAYCYSEFEEEPREIAVCDAFVSGVLADDLAGPEAARCGDAIAACSEGEQADLRTCATCISALECDAVGLTSALHRVSQVDLPYSESEPCASSCKRWNDNASEACVDAINEARWEWVEAMLKPGCEDLGGAAQRTSCDFEFVCELTCQCTNTVAVGPTYLVVECLTMPLCTYPGTFDICSNRCGSVDEYEGFSVSCP